MCRVLPAALELPRTLQLTVDPRQMGIDVLNSHGGSKRLQPSPHRFRRRNAVRSHTVEHRRCLMGDQSAQVLGCECFHFDLLLLFCSRQCLRQHNGTTPLRKPVGNLNEDSSAGYGKITLPAQQGEPSPPLSAVRCSPPATARSAAGSSRPSFAAARLSPRR